MDAKTKAQELVGKYFNATNDVMLMSEAQKCALIAVDEIIKVAAAIIDINEDYFKELRQDQTEYYWQSVKTEIENL